MEKDAERRVAQGKEKSRKADGARAIHEANVEEAMRLLQTVDCEILLDLGKDSLLALVAAHLPDEKLGHANKPLLADALLMKEVAQSVLAALRNGRQVRATAQAEAQTKAARAARQQRSAVAGHGHASALPNPP